MKILVLSSLFPPYVFGGAEIAAFNMVKQLVKRGHDVHVATVQEKGAEPAWGTLMPEGYKLYRLKRTRPYTLYDRSGETKLKKLLWHAQDYLDIRNRSQLKKLLRTVNPDHIDIHNITGLGYNALPALNNSSASVGYILHDLGLACFHTSMFKNGSNCTTQCSACKVTSFGRQHFLNDVKRIGFMSPSLATIEKLKPFAPIVAKSPSLVLHNVSDDLPAVSTRTPVNATTVPQLIYVGRLDKLKGIDFLLSVLNTLAPQFKFHLTVLGTGPEETELRARYGNCPWVTFKGFVSSAEVATHLAASHLYCIPSIWTETYGMTTVQALRLGTPVIGSNNGGTAELVRHNVTGLLVPTGDSAAWTQALTQVFTTPELLNTFSANALNYATEFDGNTIAARYEQFVATL